MNTLVFKKKENGYPLVEESSPLKKIPLFAYLTENEFEKLALNAVFKSFKKRQVMYQEGSSLRGLYCILKGIVKIYKTGTNGKQQIICFSQQGDLIAYRSLLSNELACTSAEAYGEDTSVCHIPYYILMELLKENWEFAYSMMKIMCRELKESNTFVIDIAQKTVKERTAEILLLLREKFGVDNSGILQITITREDLANMAGTVTESMIRTMSELRNEGLLDFVGRKIVFLDVRKLKNIASIL